MSSRWYSISVGLILVLASWTISSDIAYTVHQSLFVAALGAPVCLAILWIGLNRIGERSLPRKFELGLSLSLKTWLRQHRRQLQLALAILVAASLLALIAFGRIHFLIIWPALCAAYLLALLFTFVDPAGDDPPFHRERAAPRWINAFLIALCLLAALISTIAVRPDSDDASYLNISATVATQPFEPLPHYSHLYPGGSHPHPHQYVPLQAFNYLVGFLSWVLDLEPMMVAAFIITPIAAGLVVLSFAILLNELIPEHWPWGLITVLFVLFVDGSVPQFFSNMAFVRIWQGKAVVLNIMIPLLYVHGMRFGRTGLIRELFIITLLQIAMAGLSSTSIWLAPAVTAASVAVGALLKHNRLPANYMIAGVLSSVYPILIGVYVFVVLMVPVIPAQTVVEPLKILKRTSAYSYEFLAVLAPGAHMIFWLTCILLAAVLNPSRRLRLLLLTTGAVTFAIFTNPLWGRMIAQYLTQSSIYWRITWIMPILLTGMSVMLLPGMYFKQKPSLRLVVTAGVLGLYALLIPSTYTLSQDNLVQIVFPPRVKAYIGDYETAQFVAAHIPPDSPSMIVAPEDIATVLHSLRGKYYPLAHRITLYPTLSGYTPLEQDLQYYSLSYAEGTEHYDEPFMTTLLDTWPVAAFIVVDEADQIPALDRLLQSRGFVREIGIGRYLIWLKSD